MRVQSPSMMKGRSVALNRLPRPGTKSRFLYDLFYEHRGRILPVQEYLAAVDLLVAATATRSVTNLIAELTDYYGCDIRRVGHRQLSLVGEWHGRVYIDYVAEQQEAANG